MNIQKPKPDPNAPYQKMYVMLFKAVTAALCMMEDGEFMKARALLVRAQQAAEELYIEGNESAKKELRKRMDLELLAGLLDGFIFYGILYALPFLGADLLKQRNIRKLCKYRGTKEKPGPACVICAYHHQCARARQSTEYKQYSYCRRVLPDKAKQLFDEIWEEEKGKAERSK